MTHSARAAVYTNCIPAEEYDSRNECPRYDTKQYDGDTQVMLELWVIRSTSLLPSLSGPLCSGVVEPDRAPIYGSNRTKLFLCETELFEIELSYSNNVLLLKGTVWNRTVYMYKNGYGTK